MYSTVKEILIKLNCKYPRIQLPRIQPYGPRISNGYKFTLIQYMPNNSYKLATFLGKALGQLMAVV